MISLLNSIGLTPSGSSTVHIYTSTIHRKSQLTTLAGSHTSLNYIYHEECFRKTRTILGKEYRSFSSSLCSILHSPVTSSLLGPNNLLNTLFSKNLSLRSSLNVSDQVSQPYKTTGKTLILYILIFKFF